MNIYPNSNILSFCDPFTKKNLCLETYYKYCWRPHKKASNPSIINLRAPKVKLSDQGVAGEQERRWIIDSTETIRVRGSSNLRNFAGNVSKKIITVRARRLKWKSLRAIGKVEPLRFLEFASWNILCWCWFCIKERKRWTFLGCL